MLLPTVPESHDARPNQDGLNQDKSAAHHNPKDQKLEDRLDGFLSLSQSLLSLVELENAILLEEGALSFEAYIMRKVNLMNRFENEARNLLSLVLQQSESGPAKSLLIEEIRRIRDALTINSGYQMRTLTQNRREKIAAFAARQTQEGPETGEQKWH